MFIPRGPQLSPNASRAKCIRAISESPKDRLPASRFEDGVRRKSIDKRIYIGGLPLTVVESQLLELLDPFGEVVSLTLERDSFTGDSRGFAIAVMQGARAARAAIAGLKGHMVNGRRITVALAV